MTRGINKNRKNSVILIQHNIVKFDDCMFPLSSITQIWLGRIPYLYPSYISALFLLFISLTGIQIAAKIVMLSILLACLVFYAVHYYLNKDLRGVNIEINNKTIYSFVSENKEFSEKVLNLIGQISGEAEHENNYAISFQGNGSIEKTSKENLAGEKQSDKSSPSEMSGIADSKNPLVIELSQLYSYYAGQNNADTDILQLIEDTARFSAAEDKENMKTFFKKFIVSGLMKECNELNLNALISEIMSSIYS